MKSILHFEYFGTSRNSLSHSMESSPRPPLIHDLLVNQNLKSLLVAIFWPPCYRIIGLLVAYSWVARELLVGYLWITRGLLLGYSMAYSLAEPQLTRWLTHNRTAAYSVAYSQIIKRTSSLILRQSALQFNHNLNTRFISEKKFINNQLSPHSSVSYYKGLW